MNDLTLRRINNSDEAARLERLRPPESVQNTKAYRATAAAAVDIRLAYCREDAPAESFIKCVLDEPATETWDSGVTYSKGGTVLGSDGNGHKSLQDDNIGHNPVVEADEWDEGTTYDEDETATFGGQIYISLQPNNTGNTPGSSPDYWAVWSNEWWAAMENVTVYCAISGGSALNEASPRLELGDEMIVHKINSVYRSDKFQYTKVC